MLEEFKSEPKRYGPAILVWPKRAMAKNSAEWEGRGIKTTIILQYELIRQLKCISYICLAIIRVLMGHIAHIDQELAEIEAY